MRSFASMLCCVLLFAGCGSKEESLDKDPAGDDDDDTDAGCTEDEECDVGTICDQDPDSDTLGECIDGDRNNSPDEAENIPLSTDIDALIRVSGVIAPAGDVDYFVYTSAGDEWISIRTETDSGREVLDTYVVVTDPDGQPHAELDNYPTGLVSAPLDTVLYTYLPVAGDYGITVEDVTTADAYQDFFVEEDWRGGPYSTYDIYIRQAGAATEPDAADDPATTVVVDNGGTITALGILLEEPGDVDHVAIDMEVGGEPLEVWVQPDRPGSTAMAQLDLYDEADELVASKNAGAGDEDYLSYFDPSVASYRLEASDASGGSGPSSWYVIYVRTYDPEGFHPFFGSNVYDPESEPNDLEGDGDAPTPLDEQTSDGVAYTAYRFEGRIDPYDVTTTGTKKGLEDVDRFTILANGGDVVSARCFIDRFGSLLVPEITLWQDGFDRTPKGQGTEPTSLDYYIDNVEMSGSLDIQIRALGASPVGLGAYYRCVAYSTPFTIEAG